MASIIKQRLRRYNGTDYDSIYLSANVGDVTGILSTANGGTGSSSVDTTPTASSTKMVTSGGVYTALGNKADASALTTHTGNANIHVTAAQKTAWNAKADASTLTTHTGNSNIHVTAAQKTTWNSKVDTSTLTAHTGDSTIHVTSSEKSTWNGKQNALTFDSTPTSGSTNPVTSGGIYTEINTLKTSVSEGKAAIASAITDKGVSTASDASFSTMATNIGKISFDFSGANITRSDLEYGKYGWDANGNLITGRREGSVTLTPASLTLTVDSPTGTITVARAGDGVISASSSDTSVATVSVNDSIVTVRRVSETRGTATIMVNVAQGTDYKATSATCVVSAPYPNPLNTDNLTLGQHDVYFKAYPDIKWCVDHIDGDYVYLGLYNVTEKTFFNSYYGRVSYSGSDIAAKCTTFLNNTIPNVAGYLESVTVHSVTNKVFIPSVHMIDGTAGYGDDNSVVFDWTKASAANRSACASGWSTIDNNFWLSSAYNEAVIWHVRNTGFVTGNNGVSNSYWGFRPEVKVRYK